MKILLRLAVPVFERMIQVASTGLHHDDQKAAETAKKGFSQG
jgi:hypothetical protein